MPGKKLYDIRREFRNDPSKIVNDEYECQVYRNIAETLKAHTNQHYLDHFKLYVVPYISRKKSSLWRKQETFVV